MFIIPIPKPVTSQVKNVNKCKTTKNEMELFAKNNNATMRKEEFFE